MDLKSTPVISYITSIKFMWVFLKYIFFKIPSYCAGVVSNPMVQQPAMTGGLDTGSPITFPEEQDDPRVSGDISTGGGIWGFFKVIPL